MNSFIMKVRVIIGVSMSLCNFFLFSFDITLEKEEKYLHDFKDLTYIYV